MLVCLVFHLERTETGYRAPKILAYDTSVIYLYYNAIFMALVMTFLKQDMREIFLNSGWFVE